MEYAAGWRKEMLSEKEISFMDEGDLGARLS
jgi:hypothetical protein